MESTRCQNKGPWKDHGIIRLKHRRLPLKAVLKKAGSRPLLVDKNRDDGDEKVRVIPNHIPSERVHFYRGAEKGTREEVSTQNQRVR
jgi:hypothetical protein